MTAVKITDPILRSDYYERRVEWVKALKSGQYKQAKGRLVKRSYNYQTFDAYTEELSYCCLGVACEVFADKFNLKRNEDYYRDNAGEFISLMLPDELRRYLKMSTEQQNILSVANDSGATFDVIAAIIGSMDFYEEN